jgi:uncharacterized repeat protein (TIGR01451 family)
MNKHAIRSGLFLLLWSSGLCLALVFMPQPKRTVAHSVGMGHSISAWGDKNRNGSLDSAGLSEVAIGPTLTTAWSESCVNRRIVITGTGMGDSHHTLSPITLSPGNSTGIQWMVAQMSGRPDGSESVPDSVTFATNAQTLILTEPYTITTASYVFQTDLSPSEQITVSVNNPGDYKTARGLVLYRMQNMAGRWSSVGTTPNAYVYRSSYTHMLTLPHPLEQPTNLDVTAVVIDNNDDERPLVLTAVAGHRITTSGAITGPTEGPLLNIVRLTLSQVPSGTQQISVTLQSPLENGDSLVLVGLDVSYPCLNEGADLAITNTVNPTAANTGEVVTYTVTATNNGPGDASGVWVTDKLPAGLAFGGYAATQGIYTHTTGWEVGDLANAASATLVVTATVGSCAGGMVRNTAIITAPSDANPDNNEAGVDFVSSAGYCIYLPIVYENTCILYTFNSFEEDWRKAESNDSEKRTQQLNGEFQILAKNPNNTHIAWPRQQYYENYKINTQVRWTENSTGTKHGLIFGMADDRSSLYTFMIYPLTKDYEIRYFDIKNQDGQDKDGDDNPRWETLYFGHSEAITTPPHSNYLSVERVNRQIRVTVNNTDLITVTEDIQISGAGFVGIGVGPYILSGDQFADARFDNIKICPLDIGENENLNIMSRVPPQSASIPGG